MHKNAVFNSRRQALFEAWLRDGCYYKQDESYYVISKHDVKNRIKALIEKKDFATVKDLADQMKSGITLSNRNISKSLRVPFFRYASLVELAFKQKTNLSTLIRNIIVEDLGHFLVNAAKRKDVASERLELFKNSLELWQKESLEAEQTPRDSYSPSIIHYPYMSKELLKVILEKAIKQDRKKCSKIPSAIVDEYIKIDWEETIKEVYDDWPENLDQEMRLDQNGQLILGIIFSSYVKLDTNLEEFIALSREMSKQHGSETIQTLKNAFDIDENFFDPDHATEKLPIFFRLNLISVPINIAHDKLLINNVVLEDEHGDDEIRLRYKENKDKQLALLKNRLDKVLKQENWDSVSTLSDDLARIERNYQLQEHGLEIVFRLAHGTQVISFRAPEVIVRAWEAHGKFE